MPTPQEDRIIIRFLELHAQDAEAGNVRALHEYLRLFPGHDDAIATEFLRQARILTDGDTEADTGFPSEHQGLIGPYEVIEEIGRGGQGVVYRARDTRVARQVALKILDGRLAADADALVRMRREAEIASKLDHPGICVVYDTGVDDRRPWVAMRYVEGRALSAVLRERTGPPCSRESLHRDLELVAKIADALEAAHEAGVIHRDVKPANVMVTEAGQPVVLDFGLARDEDAMGPSLTASDAVLGTPAYMSPEQFRAQAGRPDRRTDVWSLGVILYLVVTGTLPFEGPTLAALSQQILSDPPTEPRRLNTSVSRDVATVVNTALQKNRADRYATAGALATDLRNIIEGRPIIARPAGPALRLKRWATRNPVLATVSGVAVVGLIGALFFALNLLASERDRVEKLRQTGDIRTLRRLVAEVGELWPIAPELVPLIDDWSSRARSVRPRRQLHAANLADLRGLKADGPYGGYDDEADAHIDDQLVEIDRLFDRIAALEVELTARRELAASLRPRSVDEASDAWDACIERVERNRRYRDLELEPQLGLVPIGPDPRSRLEEFWHVLSGERPERSDDGTLEMKPESGIVLVLVPGAEEFQIGQAIRPEDADPEKALDRAYPRGEEIQHGEPVRLDPLFVSKFEMTQAQWMRWAGGENPSYYRPGRRTQRMLSTDEITTLHPVNFVSRDAAMELLGRYGLGLPTEAQWEFAARGGQQSYWYTGWEPASLEGHANVFGGELDRRVSNRALAPHFADGHRVTAPIGSFAANPFGLHDVLGNVWEWCCDPFAPTYEVGTLRDGDGYRSIGSGESSAIDAGRGVRRGGSFNLEVEICRSGRRGPLAGEARDFFTGVRPVRPVR